MSDIGPTPLDAILKFFSRLNDDDYCWMALCCVFQIESETKAFRHRSEAEGWLNGYLKNVSHPEQKFGRVLHLIAILDFELSPQAVSRLEGRLRRIAGLEDRSLSGHAQETLRETIPRLKDVVDTWRDVRTHELDEASLWVYRDMLQSQEAAGTKGPA